jgi:hypothetical integral membrane protein (TIGR02206 family)
MDQFFAKDYAGAAFELFGPAHLAALGVVALFNVGLVVFRRRLGASARQNFRYGLAILLILNEMAWHIWNLATGQWTIQTMLPLQLCSVMVPLSAVMLVTRSYRLFEFLYFLGIGAAMQALLTPDAGRYGFPHFRAFQTFISHGSILTAAIYMTVVEGYRPYWRSLARVVVGMNLYMVVIFGFNLLIGSNYLFIARKPDTASLIDVLGPWPWYILSLEAIGLVISLLLYAPFAVRDRRARRISPV